MEKNLTKKCLEIINQTFKIYDLEIFYKRNVPVDNKILSKVMRKSEPDIKQLFIRDKNKKISSDKFNLKLFLTGKIISNKINKESKKDKRYKLFYICSISNSIWNFVIASIRHSFYFYFVTVSRNGITGLNVHNLQSCQRFSSH